MRFGSTNRTVGLVGKIQQARAGIAISEAEEELGFAVMPLRHGVITIAVELRRGLLAVKGFGADGAVEYRICDPNLDQLYATASSLSELRWRFGIDARSGVRKRAREQAARTRG